MVDKEGVVPILITPTIRDKLRDYKISNLLRNYSKAIEELLKK